MKTMDRSCSSLLKQKWWTWPFWHCKYRFYRAWQWNTQHNTDSRQTISKQLCYTISYSYVCCTAACAFP